MKLILRLSLACLGLIAFGQISFSNPFVLTPPLVWKATIAGYVDESFKPTTPPRFNEPADFEFPNGVKKHAVLDPEANLPIFTKVRQGDDTKIVVPPGTYGTVSVFPVTAFTIGGPSFQTNGGLLGGTTTVWGTLVSADLGVRMGRSRSLDIGGFYFLNSKSPALGSIYEGQIRYTFRDSLGLELGYLNSTKVHTPAATLHFVYTLDSGRVQPEAKNPWGIELGIGVLDDLSDQTVIDQNGVVTKEHRASVNFSTYFQGRVQIAKRTSLVGSAWFFRDRNVDVNRFALGLSYSF